MTEDPPKVGYFRRQVYVLGSLGLFYIIIIAMFAIPLLGTFVIILIKGVVDLRYVILAGFALLGVVGLLLLIRLVRYMFQKVKTDGTLLHQNMQTYRRNGQPVQLSLFRGLISLSYGGNSAAMPPQLESGRDAVRLLPSSAAMGSSAPSDYCLGRLEVLSGMLEKGWLTPEEYAHLKSQLLYDLAEQTGRMSAAGVTPGRPLPPHDGAGNDAQFQVQSG